MLALLASRLKMVEFQGSTVHVDNIIVNYICNLYGNVPVKNKQIKLSALHLAVNMQNFNLILPLTS